ncbi:MAG: outer membrane beta-barrel domain-containing protein [Deltaproteobacteria bacterium]|nr:outer membrane beta-barrel domain-containing protein [Deltaproteobacteria bacterium]
MTSPKTVSPLAKRICRSIGRLLVETEAPRGPDATQKRMRIAVMALSGLAVMASELPRAHALQGGEDPALLPVLVDKRFGKKSAHQLGLQFSTAMATKFVEDNGVVLTYGYNFSDLIGLELGGGFFFGQESNIMDEVRAQFAGVEPPLSDLHQIQWMAMADLMLVPLYGKMSFASELDPSYDLFILAGAGVGGLRKQSGYLDKVSGADSRTYASATQPIFNFGLGLRFYFSRLVALRVEFRDYFYPDPLPNPNDDPKKETDPLTWGLHFQAGLQLSFGGA